MSNNTVSISGSIELLSWPSDSQHQLTCRTSFCWIQLIKKMAPIIIQRTIIFDYLMVDYQVGDAKYEREKGLLKKDNKNNEI